MRPRHLKPLSQPPARDRADCYIIMENSRQREPSQRPTRRARGLWTGHQNDIHTPRAPWTIGGSSGPSGSYRLSDLGGQDNCQDLLKGEQFVFAGLFEIFQVSEVSLAEQRGTFSSSPRSKLGTPTCLSITSPPTC